MTALGTLFAELDRRLSIVPGVLEYERMPPGDPSRWPALQLFDNGDESIDAEPGGLRLATTVTVEGWCRGVGGALVHDQLLQLHADTVKALCSDGGDLGGLVQTIEIVGQRRVAIKELAETREIGFAQDFMITFATPRGDPSTFA